MSRGNKEISREEIDACIANEILPEDVRIDPADGLPYCVRCGGRRANVKLLPVPKRKLMVAWFK